MKKRGGLKIKLKFARSFVLWGKRNLRLRKQRVKGVHGRWEIAWRLFKFPTHNLRLFGKKNESKGTKETKKKGEFGKEIEIFMSAVLVGLVAG